MNFLVFSLDGERHALAAEAVHELFRCVLPTFLPGSPAVVEGVIDYRGTLVPVLNPRVRLGLRDRLALPDDHLVIARTGRRDVALRVDRVIDLVELDAPEGGDAAPVRLGNEVIAGILRLPSGLVLLEDLDRFLSQAEDAALDAALGRASEAAS